jgi:type IV secretory pathway VirB2 component (pilin)
MKWIAIIAVAVIGIMIATGNMGGAKKATDNYVKVRGGGAE